MRIKRTAVKTRGAVCHIFACLSVTTAIASMLIINGMIHFLSSSSKNGANKNMTPLRPIIAPENRSNNLANGSATVTEEKHKHILSLTLDTSPATIIRIAVLKKECPKAYEFISFIVENQRAECHPCTIYRGEPVPDYWGSEDYPNRYFDGGRWGPPYALVQGGFVNSKFKQVVQDQNRPKILKRGMVAWAGGNSIHFFIALADHPEWGDFHTAWGEVLQEDMPLVDALVKERPLTKLERHNPVVTNFLEPMHFQLKWESVRNED